MKAFTKKEFKNACFATIERMNDEELEIVRKGLKTICIKLKDETETLKVKNLNEISRFLVDIASTATVETLVRAKKEELHY